MTAHDDPQAGELTAEPRLRVEALKAIVAWSRAAQVPAGEDMVELFNERTRLHCGRIVTSEDVDARRASTSGEAEGLRGALEKIAEADRTQCDVSRYGGRSNIQSMCWASDTADIARAALTVGEADGGGKANQAHSMEHAARLEALVERIRKAHALHDLRVSFAPDELGDLLDLVPLASSTTERAAATGGEALTKAAACIHAAASRVGPGATLPMLLDWLREYAPERYVALRPQKPLPEGEGGVR